MNAEKLVATILDSDLKMYKNNCPLDITDKVFCVIENKYMQEYNDLCNILGQNQLNITIGKFIKRYWGLKNLGRCNNPVSNLIKSYEKHSN